MKLRTFIGPLAIALFLMPIELVVTSNFFFDKVYIYKQGWKSIHKKYKACQSKCEHTKGK